MHPPKKEPYKAFVMLFMAGGADTWNMLVPHPKCRALYNQYKRARGDLALEQGDVFEVPVRNQPCDSFGIHRSLGFLAKSFYQKEAAFITDVGNLVEPTTLESYRDGTAVKCLNLFSHTDQQVGAQTLKCQDSGTSAKGVGGRLADALAKGSRGYNTQSFSLAGRAIWPMGEFTRRDILDEKGIKKFSAYEMNLATISNISAQRHGNAYASAYDDELQHSIELTQTLSSVVEKAQLATDFPKGSRLMRELSQVAKLIAARDERNAERDIFFVSVGGWDMHTLLNSRLRAGFAEVDRALASFVAEMKAQGIWERVALASFSEFGRTLESSGGGSDHGWAGQSFLMGGSVLGRRVLNRYPDRFVRNARDIGRGRLIPGNPWEGMLKPIAEWMGLEETWSSYVFPNLRNFPARGILTRARMFKR